MITSLRTHLYDEDFYGWANQQAAFLRAGRLNLVDIDNICEELETLARREKRELTEALTALMHGLLRWSCQTGHQSKSQSMRLELSRLSARDLMRDNPSLLPKNPDLVEEAYRRARMAAIIATGFAKSNFPETMPWPFEETLKESWLPEDRPFTF
jgi:hypothetical protein